MSIRSESLVERQVATANTAAAALLFALLPDRKQAIERLVRSERMVQNKKKTGLVAAALACARDALPLAPYQEQTRAGFWTGIPGGYDMQAWMPFVMNGAAQFRSEPPGVFDEKAVAEVIDWKRSPEQTKRAEDWAKKPVNLFYNEKLIELLPEKMRLEAIAERFAVLNVALLDALIGCFDSKYAYRAPRPNQLAPTFQPLIPTPSFPGYPSGHGTQAGPA